jgi:uncharacterized tellurite resistance protein B-like protein
MAFWDLFQTKSQTETSKSGLQVKVEQLLPTYGPQELERVTCVAGLLAKVAYTDFEVHQKEKASMAQALEKWTALSPEEVSAISNLAIEQIKELAGLEDHLYSYPLENHMNEKERFGLLKALFSLAASDGNVDNSESEEIRQIAKNLRLSHEHFIAARASVLEYLGALKK